MMPDVEVCHYRICCSIILLHSNSCEYNHGWSTLFRLSASTPSATSNTEEQPQVVNTVQIIWRVDPAQIIYE